MPEPSADDIARATEFLAGSQLGDLQHVIQSLAKFRAVARYEALMDAYEAFSPITWECAGRSGHEIVLIRRKIRDLIP